MRFSGSAPFPATAPVHGSACTTTQAVGKKGRLTAARSTVSTTRYTSFDKLGRVKGSSQQTGGATHRFRLAA